MKQSLLFSLFFFFLYCGGFSQTPTISITTNDETSICKEKTTPTTLTANVGSYSGNTQFLNASENSSNQVSCNCPPGYVAVGYRVRAGQWMDQIQLACKKLNPDGTLDPNVVFTSSGGGNGGSDAGTAVFDNSKTVLVGAQLTRNIYYSSDASTITGYGQPISNIIAGKDNSSGATSLATLGASDYSTYAGTAYAPAGTLITGMTVVNDYGFYGDGPYVGGISFRYSSINELLKNYKVTWSNGQTGSSISVLPTVTTTYTAMVTNDGGLSASASQVITIIANQLPAPAITAPATSFCPGGTTTISAPGGFAAYQWSNGATTQLVTIGQNGSYSVTVTASNGCSATSAAVKIMAAPNSADLYVDGSISTSGEGTSWASAFKTLQEAFSAASGCNAIKNIWVAKGTYKPAVATRDSAFAILRGGLKMYGGFPSGGGSRNITANTTILSGDIGIANNNSDNSYHVLVIAGLTSNDDSLVVDGFTISDGNANGNTSSNYGITGASEGNGGGAYIINNANGSKIALRNLVVSNNHADYVAGGFEINHSSPIISGCIFTHNSSGYNGAGMFNEESSSPTVTNCLFVSNSSNANGGGMYNLSSSPAVTNCTFYANNSNSGSGIYNDYSSSIITNCVIWGNTGDNAGIYSNNETPAVTYSDVQSDYTGTGNINMDPLFVDAVNGDLRLQACSPAINAGDNSSNAADKDLDGKSRVVGNTIDMGAYEFQGQTGQASIINMPQPVTVCAGTQAKFSVTATGAGLSFQWQKNGVDINGATDSVYSIASANASDTGNYKVVVSGVCGSPVISDSAHLTVNTVPAPVVTVADNCGSSLLSTTATGSLLWSTGETTPSITVNSANTYTVTQTVNGCTSIAGSATVNPKTIPAAPVVTVTNNCGNSTLSTSATGTLLWSTGETTPSVTVNNAGTYTVTQTVNGCTSTQGSGTTAPKTVPAAPAVTVTNNCGSAALSTTAAGSLLWSTGETTPSITVSNAGNYTVKQTVNGCTSDAGSGTAAPKTIPATPVINVTNSCGSSTLSTNATGSLLWSNGATTPSIAVNTAGTYTVTQTLNGCTSTAGSATAAPKTPPATPVVTVVNGCGSSTLSIPSGGSILWSTGATTPSITINKAGTYTVTRTVNGCTSAPGSGTAAPTKGILITVNNISVFVTVKNCGSPVTFGSNVTVTGNTTPPVYKIGNTVITSPHTFPVGTTIVTVIASNSCSNANATFLVIVNDNQAPVITCKPGATKTTSSSTYTIAGKEFDATATDNCGTPSLIYSLSGATGAAYKSTNTTLAGVKLKTGTTTITWKATDASGNATTCSTVVKVSKSCSVNARSNEQTTDKMIAPEEAGASDALVMSVYPNPATTSATLSLSSVSNDVKVSLADLSGRVLWKMEKITDRNIKIPVANLANGTYLVLVQDKTQTKTLKLIKAE